MLANNPQFLYMILLLPGLFGLVLLGEGMNKIIHSEWQGLVTLVFGIAFIGFVIFSYLFFASYIGENV